MHLKGTRSLFFPCLSALLWLLGTMFLFENFGVAYLRIDLVSEAQDTAQLFYSRDGQWSEELSSGGALNKGWNRVSLRTTWLPLGPSVRFDPGMRAAAHYRILNMTWWRAGIAYAVRLEKLTNARPGASTLSTANGELVLDSGDNDAQLIIPTPGASWEWQCFLLLGTAPAIALLALYFMMRRLTVIGLATSFIALCSAFYVLVSLHYGQDLPLFDDWRYVLPGRFNMIDGSWQWLTAVTNDTYYLTNQLLDFAVLRLSNIDFLWVRALSLVLLVLQVVLQGRLLFRVARERPEIAAVAIALLVWSLAAGAYWSSIAVAYQQALPILCCTAMLLAILQSAETSRVPIVLLVIAGSAAGASYISGAIAVGALGVSCLLTAGPRHPAVRRSGWLLVALGAGFFVLQYGLVASQQSFLLERNSAVASVYPTDWRFWIFFCGQFGRAFGYRGHWASIDAGFTLLALLPIALLMLSVLRRAVTRGGDDRKLDTWLLLALFAGIHSVLYDSAVSFGRAGFIPTSSSVADAVLASKGRFHFWPIAAMLPFFWLGYAELADRIGLRGRALRNAAGLAFLLPKSISAFALTAYLFGLDDIARSGAHCVVDHQADVDAKRPFDCRNFTGTPVDLSTTIADLRARNAVMYARLMQEGSKP